MTQADVYGQAYDHDDEPGPHPVESVKAVSRSLSFFTGRVFGYFVIALVYTVGIAGVAFWAGSHGQQSCQRVHFGPLNAPLTASGAIRNDPKIGDGVFATLKVAHLPFSRNWAQTKVVPAEFWIEVGANSRNVLQDEMQDAFKRGAFLLTFEPLLDKYAYLLTRFGGQPDRIRQLGLQHERGVVLPFAVGCNGTATFHVAPVDGCSSLLEPRGKAFAHDPKKTKWGHWVESACVTTSELRTVPCISLEMVIEDWLEARDVQYLKVDAQGFDLQVVKSAGRMREKLKRVHLEVQCDNAAMLYSGQPNCSTTYWEMLRLGFRSKFNPGTCLTCTETDIEFFRL